MYEFVLSLRLNNLNINHRIRVNRLLNFIQDTFFENMARLSYILYRKVNHTVSFFVISFTASFSSPRTHSIKSNRIKNKKIRHLIADANITEVFMYESRMGFFKIHITVVCTLFNDAVRNSRVCSL
jgi:hypothetical protein